MTIDNSDVYIKKYYTAFVAFLNSVGSHQAIVKMRDNAEDGVYPVQVVAARYGYTEAKIDQEVAERDSRRRSNLRDLNYWARRVGFRPLSPEGMEKFLKFCEDKDRRRYLRDKVRRLEDKGELMPIDELMLARYRVEKKRARST